MRFLVQMCLCLSINRLVTHNVESWVSDDQFLLFGISGLLGLNSLYKENKEDSLHFGGFYGE